MKSLRKLSLVWRLSLSSILALLAMLLISWDSMSNMHDQLLEDRQVKTRHLVEVAHGVVDSFYQRAQRGELTEPEAQQQAKAAIKRLRYEGKEYFWINDMGTPAPTMVMHATVPALEGKVLDAPRFNKAVSARIGGAEKTVPLDNKNLFVAFVDVVREGKQGFVEYQWPRPKAGGGVTEELYLKLSYVKGFEPWGWVIGTGIYIDDVDQLFKEHALRSALLTAAGTLLVLIVGLLVRKSILGELGGEPKVALKFTGRIAEGDLTGDIHLQSGDTQSVLAVIRQMQSGLRDMLKTLYTNARHLEVSVERLSAESNEISLATQLQNSAIEQTRAAIQDVSSSVDVVNGLVSETESGSEQMATHANNGAEIANRVALEMQDIASTVSSSSAQVSRLADSTREIETMSQVISDIAEQTNLLALNAAIEAARAGDQGRGFAVVADEVRQLAARTSKATEEIATILSRVQEDTRTAVEGMEKATPLIAQGVDEANTAAGTLRAIEERSHDILSKMAELTGATNDQAERITEILANIDDLMNASNRTEGVIAKSLDSASDLEATAKTMFDMVSSFNIGEVEEQEALENSAGGKPLIAWSTTLEVGHKEIDAQHFTLVEIANRLNSAMSSGQGREQLGTILDELVDYTVNHFAFEERLMERVGYSESANHAREHQKLIEDVSRFKQQFEAGNDSISVDLMRFIRDWLVNHILKVDKALARDLKRRGLE